MIRLPISSIVTETLRKSEALFDSVTAVLNTKSRVYHTAYKHEHILYVIMQKRAKHSILHINPFSGELLEFGEFSSVKEAIQDLYNQAKAGVL